MAIRTLDDLSVGGTSIGVRIDINSPLTPNGELADDARLKAHVGTLTELLERGGRVTILAHQGRPGGDQFEPLEPHATRLDEMLDAPVAYSDATASACAREAIDDLDRGEALLLENTRFYSEEYMEFDPERAGRTHLVRRLAPHFDAFVNDAFAAAHRSQPSLVGFSAVLPAYAGRVMEAEIDVLGSIDETPTPRAYVLGGAKVTDSIDIIRHGLETGRVDIILTAGLVGNVFLLASGVDLGDATAEYLLDHGYWDEIDRAAELLEAHEDSIYVPKDVAFHRDGSRVEVPVPDLPPNQNGKVKDIGPETLERYSDLLSQVGTIVLNGPAGVFEERGFRSGTRGLFEIVAEAEYSLVGGGDTAAAIRQLGIEGFEHISTGGGATLRMLTEGNLPAIEALSR